MKAYEYIIKKMERIKELVQQKATGQITIKILLNNGGMTKKSFGFEEFE